MADRLAVALIAGLAAAVSAVPDAVSQQPTYPDPGILYVESTPGHPVASYRREDLARAFPLHEIRTRTPWTDEKHVVRYRGPYLKDVLARSGFGDAPEVEVYAFDQFQTDITKSEIDQYKPILAIERECNDQDRARKACADGQEFKPLDLDDSGPFYIVWPYNSLPPSYTPQRNSIWVWFAVALRPVVR
ncbi:hypothetical protein [Inquilinus limosus]|uniref:hypothetical protein n=1 Tax=Inquilinus limosus TaxID=171674 RepID=UPI0004179FDE|nr:hypothetical protein [Inquilinus limosus]